MKSKLLSSIYLLFIIPIFNNIVQSDFKSLNNMVTDNLESIYLGAGCFWCVEAIFQQVNGVIKVTPGYCGGHTKNPTYNEVCSGTSGHVEVAKIVYDKSLVTLDYLLEVFWKTHDPTTLNRQGNDIGTQYRSAIFYNNEDQKILAEDYKKELISKKVFENSIVTEILKINVFYPAENYHHNYYNNNKNQGYCQYVIQPKIEKYKKIFSKNSKTK